MKPLMYGYVRVSGVADENDVRRLENGMRQLADNEGFCYAATFHENVSGSHAAFIELTEELRRAEAHHVVVPSLDHLSRNEFWRARLLSTLEYEANTHVWSVQP